MAYVNEFGETISHTVPLIDKVKNFFSLLFFTLLPLAVLVAIFFVLKKYTKNKIILIGYVVVALLLYSWWLPKSFIIHVG